MRRADRRRVERRRTLILTIGLSFALGALSAGGLSWRLERAVAPGVEDATAAARGHTPIDASDPDAEQFEDEPVGTSAAAPAAPSGRTPATAGTSGTLSGNDAIADLRSRDLLFPVDGVSPDDVADTFDDPRGSARSHEALDIMAPRHTPVRSVEDGRIARLFTSQAGGLTIYVFDPTETYCYYYAHLDRYAPGLKEGQAVSRGQMLGYVGSTGNASESAPHLHFAIFELTSERQWWKGEPINPYPVLRDR
jgi:murein DD-endopeptidase MepM/ murein hydrolase activator NlpD